MYPFSLNTPKVFPPTRSPHCFNSLPNLTELQNLQNLQRLQTLQQTLQNQVNLASLDSLSPSYGFHNFPTTPSTANIRSLLHQFNLSSQVSPTSMLGCSDIRNSSLSQEMTGQILNLMMTWKMQNNIQSEMYKNQMNQLLEMQKELAMKLKEKHVAHVKSMITEESHSLQVEPKAKIMVKDQPISTKRVLKCQIREIIQYVLEHSGRVSDIQIEEEKAKYANDDNLVAIFDGLVCKYASTIKTKEEMVKYTLRKAFKFIKNQVKKENRFDSKETSAYLCKRYFKNYSGQVPDLENEEDFLKVVLPFRKSSKNKTMNSSFITEIFAYNEFRADYLNFLENLDDILEADNNGKIERFVSFIEDNFKKNKIPDIKAFKRIPWPQVWNTNTMKIAHELLETGAHGFSEGHVKKVKRSSTEMTNSPNSSESDTVGMLESSPSNTN